MSKITLLTTMMAVAMGTPAAVADITTGFPGFSYMNASAQGNCSMMATNTVLANFVGLRNLTVQRIDQEAPTSVQVAVFQVTDSLDYRQYNRFADGRLTPGMQFTIAMNKELPGQPAEHVDTIAAMQPGESVVMRVDHLYLMNGHAGESIRTCARLARRTAPAIAATPAPQPAAPEALPIPGASPQPTLQMRSRRFAMIADSSGQMHSIQTSREYDPTTGQIKTRMFIDGVEVDPNTRQPLAPVAAPQQPAGSTPVPAPVSETQAQQEAEADSEDDTIVEHNTNPVLQPGDKEPLLQENTPATAPIPAPAPATDALPSEDNF